MASKTITCPFTILIDGREKAPYRFTGLQADAAQQRRPLIVPTRWEHLATGDYTIDGSQDQVAVERKSLDDLFTTLGSHRERFEREHQRLAAMRRAIVVIEATWWDVIHWPPERSRLNPKTVFRTAVSWQVRYGVPWITAVDRRLAEIWTFRFLQRCHKEVANGKEESHEEHTQTVPY
jgi:ERCC4-type nuclease